MEATWFLPLFFLSIGLFSTGYGRNVSSRPDVVTIGALLTFDSTIGRVAKIAINEAVKDVNSNPSILHGTKLAVAMENANCSGFLGMVEALHFMETDVVAIVGPQCSTVAHMISYVANELQVPLLSFGATDPTLSSLQFPFFVRTTQNDMYQMTAIAEIVKHYGWNSVIAIYVDDDYGRNGILALSNKLDERRCKISYKAGISPVSEVTQADIMNILVKVALMESRIIVLHVGILLGPRVFSVAKYLGMMGNGYVWIATDWLATTLDTSSPLPSETMENMEGVLVLRQHVSNSERKKAFQSRWNNLTGGSPGLNTYGFYAYDSVWLVAHAIDDFLNQGGVISFSNDSRLRAVEGDNLNLDALTIFDSGTVLLNKILQNNVTGLTGPLQFTSDRSLVHPAYDIINVVGTGFRRIGYWSNYSGLSTVPPETLYSKPLNRTSRTKNRTSRTKKELFSVLWPGGETLTVPRGWVFPNNGKQLRIGVPIRVGFREFVSQVRGTDDFKGFCIDVFQAAVNLLPYAVPYRFIPFGNGRENPSYDELVRLVTAGNFDGVVGDIAIVTNRTRFVDFTLPYASSGLVVVAPFKKLNSGAWAFLQPFSPWLWTVTAVFFLCVGIVVWILEHRVNDEFRGTPKSQIITILWFSFSTLFFAHRENTVSTLGRLVLILWMFVVLIINASYTASLTSILTVQQLFSPINGIESLRKSDDPIGYQVGSFAEHYLSKELNISKSRLKPLGSPEQYAAALNLGPQKGGVSAIVDERKYVELFLGSECTFKIVGQEFTKSGWGFAFPRDSPLAIDLSTAILTLAENGDLQRINNKWLVQNTCALEKAEIDSDRLQLKSFWGLFLVCAAFCFLALLIYFTQIVRKLRRSAPVDSESDGQRNSRSGSLHRFLSIMDEKSGQSQSKKRKVESDNELDETPRINV